MKRVKMIEAPTSEQLAEKINIVLEDLDFKGAGPSSEETELHYQVGHSGHHFCILEYYTGMD